MPDTWRNHRVSTASSASRSKDPHDSSEEYTSALIHDGECRDGERDEPHVQIVPIKGRPRVQTHTRVKSADGREGRIVGSDPGDPAEDGQGLKDKAREEKVTEELGVSEALTGTVYFCGWDARHSHEHRAKGQQESLLSRRGVDPTEWTTNGLIGRCVEGLDQSNIGERRRPDGDTRVDEESTGQASQTIPNEIGADRAQELIATTVGERLVKVDGQRLSGYDVVGVRRGERDGAHDGDEHVFFLVERAGVQAVLATEQAEPIIGEDLVQEFPKGICSLVSIKQNAARP